VLDSGVEGPGFKSQSRRCLTQTVHTHCASVHQAAKLVAAFFRVAGVTAGLAKSNRSPYSITERIVPELIPVLDSQPAGDVSHKPGGRLSLLSVKNWDISLEQSCIWNTKKCKSYRGERAHKTVTACQPHHKQ